MVSLAARIVGWIRVFGVALIALWPATCHRKDIPDGTRIYTPFNERKPVAVLRSTVEGETIRIEVESLMLGRLALRVLTLGIVDGAGGQLQRVPLPRTCLMAGGAVATLRRSGADLRVVAPVARLHAEAVAIPLDNPGRAMYREWAWLRRPGEIAQIDGELRALDELAECGIEW